MKNIPFISIIMLILGCSGNKSYPVRGTIIEVRQESNELLIHHDEIPRFMVAMTMPFQLGDSTDINRYHVGDSLKFRLEMGEKRAIASNFQLL